MTMGSLMLALAMVFGAGEAVDGAKVQIAAGVTADSVGKVKAGELVNFVAQQVGGKGLGVQQRGGARLNGELRFIRQRREFW